MCVEISAPEQTASGGGIGENLKVLGEGVKRFVEGFWPEGGGGEVKAESNEGWAEGKGRQNVVLGHYGPFQKTSEAGSGNDGGGASAGTLAGNKPKLIVPENPRGVVEESFLEEDEVPWSLGAEVVEERAYVCLSECASIPGPNGKTFPPATRWHT